MTKTQMKRAMLAPTTPATPIERTSWGFVIQERARSDSGVPLRIVMLIVGVALVISAGLVWITPGLGNGMLGLSVRLALSLGFIYGALPLILPRDRQIGREVQVDLTRRQIRVMGRWTGGASQLARVVLFDEIGRVGAEAGCFQVYDRRGGLLDEFDLGSERVSQQMQMALAA